MSVVKFKPVEELEDGWSDWVFPTPRAPYKMKCCDCGLVHDLQFEAIEVERKRGGWVVVIAALDPAKYWLRFKARREGKRGA